MFLQVRTRQIGNGSHPTGLITDGQKYRVRREANPEWQAFLPNIREIIENADNKIMKPASLSPTGGSLFA